MKGELGAHARAGPSASVEHLRDLRAPAGQPRRLPRHILRRHQLEEREGGHRRGHRGSQTDLGIIADPPDTADLESWPFREDRLVLVVPARHALARRRLIRFTEALDHDLVGLSHGSALQAHLARHAARLGKRMRLRVRLTGFDAQCRLVEHGAGLAIVPAAAARAGGPASASCGCAILVGAPAADLPAPLGRLADPCPQAVGASEKSAREP